MYHGNHKGGKHKMPSGKMMSDKEMDKMMGVAAKKKRKILGQKK